MRFISIVRSLGLAGVTVGLLVAGGACAQDFAAPFFGGAYAPGPSYAYGGYNGGAVGYDQGYYQGGYQYPAAGYGGGPYRRAAYSAADVYMNAGYAYERTYVVPETVYQPYVRTYYVPVTTYRTYNTIAYQPVTRYRVVRKRCHYDTLY
jgi:hypothetical protein